MDSSSIGNSSIGNSSITPPQSSAGAGARGWQADQTTAHDQQGRLVSHAPQLNSTSNSLSQAPASPSQNEGLPKHLRILSYLDCNQLASLMQSPQPMIGQKPGPANHKPVSRVVHYHGQVAITHCAGIPADTNNSALAALFMGLSHNRLSEVIAEEVSQRVEGLSDHDTSNSLQILQHLSEALNTLCFDHQAHSFIPGDSLNHLRTIYQPCDARPDTPLDPTELVKLILNDIYERTGCHRDIFLSDQSDARRKVAFIDVASDQILIRNYVEPSRNLDPLIRCHRVPNNLVPDNETADDAPDPRNPAIIAHSKAAYKNNKLLAKFTARVEHPEKKLKHLTFSFLQDELNGRYLHGELESDWHPGQKRFFTRSLTIRVTNDLAVPMAIEKKMEGYDTHTPDRGRITTCVYRRATNVGEMITDAWLSQMETQRGIGALEQLLPDHDDCPPLLIVTPPDYGIDQQIDLDWHRDIHLPTSTGDGNVPYELSAIISRDKDHSLAWLFDQDGLIHCTDARGKTTPNGDILPTVVTMPFPGTEDALQMACQGQNCTEDQQNTYNVTAQRFAKLGKTACLLIYRKKDGD